MWWFKSKKPAAPPEPTEATAPTAPGVTFAVDKVKPTKERLAEYRTHEALRDLFGAVESCHDYHGTVVKGVYFQPLLAAVHMAFSGHRPLVLTPDAVWITIAQGVAHHMVIHGERLRSRFVAHQGKLELVFECLDWADGSPENPWAEAFDSWAAQIREHVGPELHDTLVCDFSTSGPTERAASQIVMMDIFERYFHFRAVCICGIPSVTLEGTTADWERLAEKVNGLKVFDMDWWLDHLRPICDQFVRASRGDIDQKHWKSICKLEEAYGGDIINGWVAKLFPYLRSFIGGPCNRRNPIFETGNGFQTLVAPPVLSCVPFTWENLGTGTKRAMEAVGGLVGVTQNPKTLALRPKVGWAIREAAKADVTLARLRKDHTTFPGAKSPKVGDEDWEGETGLPADLSKFYHHTNGADLFGAGPAARYRIVPQEEITPLEWGEDPKHSHGSYGPGGRIWHRIATLADGSWLAINLDANLHNAPWADDPKAFDLQQSIGYELFAPICHGSTATQKKPGANPVVALSFTELLERLLDSGERPYWLDPKFKSYGDAERYTRRE
jgi:hypothetical protein